MGRRQATHLVGLGVGLPVIERNLHPVWGTPGAGHRQWDTIHGREGRSDEPSNFEGREEAAPKGEGLLGPGAPNHSLVLPDDPESHHRGRPPSTWGAVAQLGPVGGEKGYCGWQDGQIQGKGSRLLQKKGPGQKIPRRRSSPQSTIEMRSWEARKDGVPPEGPIPWRQVPQSWNICHLRKYYV
ncbi:hypothetical protein LIER_07619 [Lithospermum erythrorhizon]|uniref:Uncharacterized protein n=1 Tax=Lithospermum erythrorhizon TaxID=34254 RepID=A0AAV3P9H2_LITER